MKAFKIKLVLFILIGISLIARKSVCKEIYTVRPGDLIEKVSVIYNVSPLEILSANPPDKFIPVCVREKEFTAENGNKFKLCQKVTYWLKAGAQINIPASPVLPAVDTEKQDLERQNQELLAKLQAERGKYEKMAQEKGQEQENSLEKLFKFLSIVLVFCILMSAAIGAIVFNLIKINRKILINGKSYQSAELAALQAEVAIEKHNLWERQKEMAAIMADLKQEKLGLRKEREGLEEGRRQLEEEKKAIDAKTMDLRNIERGLENWAKKKKGEFEARENEIKRLQEKLEVLDLSNLEDETTLEQGAAEPVQVGESEQEQKQKRPGQEGWENNPTRRVEAPESKSRKGLPKKKREAPV